MKHMGLDLKSSYYEKALNLTGSVVCEVNKLEVLIHDVFEIENALNANLNDFIDTENKVLLPSKEMTTNLLENTVLGVAI